MTSFGLAVPQALCGFDPSGAPVKVDLDRWLEVFEAPGVESLGVLDQPTGSTAVPEPLTLLGHVAALTSRPRLGVAVLIAAARGPVTTAKALATIDWMSGGRVEAGFGLGAATAYGAYGVDRQGGGGAGAILDELLDMVEQLWTGEPVHHEGQTWRLAGEAVNPRPLQRPGPPVWIGGESDAALRRVADFGQGWFGFNRTPEEVPEALARLDGELERVGRTRADVEITVSPYLKGVDRAAIERFAELGVDRVVVVVFGFDRDGLLTTLDQMVNEIVEPANAL